MRTRILGLVTGLALLGAGTAAASGDVQEQQQTQHESKEGLSTGGQGAEDTSKNGKATVTVEEGTGGSGQSGQATGQSQTGAQAGASANSAAENSLTGKVVKADRNTVHLLTDQGAVVSLKVDKQTQFGDPSLKSAKDLKEGQQVRASFTVKKTDNLATRLEAMGGSLGTGGAGSQSGASGSSGTGGSGSQDSGLSGSGSSGSSTSGSSSAGSSSSGSATSGDEKGDSGK